MNNKTIQFNCVKCTTPVYRLGSRVDVQNKLCGRCKNRPVKPSARAVDQIKVKTEVIGQLEKEIDPEFHLELKEYNQQWNAGDPQTQSLETFLNKSEPKS